jgi:hypothetical protein
VRFGDWKSKTGGGEEDVGGKKDRKGGRKLRGKRCGGEI